MSTATKTRKRQPKTAKHEYWQSYRVFTNGEVSVGRNYEVGHSMKCRWTAFVHEHEENGSPGKWWIAEDTDTRKVIAYDDEIVKMAVFQLITIDAILTSPTPKPRKKR